MSFLNHTRAGWRARRAGGHGHAEQQHYLLPPAPISGDSHRALRNFSQAFLSRHFSFPPAPKCPQGSVSGVPGGCEGPGFPRHRSLHSQNSSRLPLHLPGRAIRAGEAQEEFHTPFPEPWKRHGNMALADSYLCCRTGPTGLLITLLLNKLGMLEAQDTPRTSVHVGSIYLPLSFLRALTGARPLVTVPPPGGSG